MILRYNSVYIDFKMPIYRQISEINMISGRNNIWWGDEVFFINSLEHFGCLFYRSELETPIKYNYLTISRKLWGRLIK